MAQVIRRFVIGATQAVGEREFEGIACTSEYQEQDNLALRMEGGDFSRFDDGRGKVFVEHDSTDAFATVPRLKPAGGILRFAGSIFTDDCLSEKGKLAARQLKAGVLDSFSIGFTVEETEPLIGEAYPLGARQATKWTLLEISACHLPVDVKAVVTARSRGQTSRVAEQAGAVTVQRSDSADDWKCGASRDMPIEDSDAWDGSAAEDSIFEWAGGDDFDPSKARKGFLAYNAAKPKLRGSYKLPIAHIVGGRLKVPKGAIRAAASRLPQADLPDSVKEAARAVLDSYEEKAGMSGNSGGDRSATSTQTRSGAPVFKRGMYEVAQFAYTLMTLAGIHDHTVWEEAMEEDTDSQLPGLLKALCEQAAEAFQQMSKEEVAELLERIEEKHEDDDAVPDGERAFVAAAKTRRSRAFRTGIAAFRAGRVLSKANQENLEKAMKAHKRSMSQHEEIGEAHEDADGHMDRADKAHGEAQDALDAACGAMGKARSAHGELGEALEAVQNEPAKATEHVARALRCHRAVADHHDAVDGHHEDAVQAHQDLETAHGKVDSAHEEIDGAHDKMGKHLATTQRCMRAVLDGAEGSASGTDGNSKSVQTSAGTAESAGSANGRALRQKHIEERRARHQQRSDLRKRQAEARKLTRAPR